MFADSRWRLNFKQNDIQPNDMTLGIKIKNDTQNNDPQQNDNQWPVL